MRPYFWKQLSLQPIFEEMSKLLLWDLCIRTKPGVQMTAIKTWAIQVTLLNSQHHQNWPFRHSLSSPNRMKLLRASDVEQRDRGALGPGSQTALRDDCARWTSGGVGAAPREGNLLLKLFIWSKFHRLDDSHRRLPRFTCLFKWMCSNPLVPKVVTFISLFRNQTLMWKRWSTGRAGKEIQ